METPQHGNGSKIRGNPSKTGFFLRHFRDFFKFFRNPSKFKFLRSFLFFFDRFTRIVYPFMLYFTQIFSRDFPIFLRGFPIFLVRFLIFLWSVSSFFKNFEIDMFPRIFDQFTQILGPFPLVFLIRFGFFQKLEKSRTNYY